MGIMLLVLGTAVCLYFLAAKPCDTGIIGYPIKPKIEPNIPSAIAQVDPHFYKES
jgi:hypothetical protein